MEDLSEPSMPFYQRVESYARPTDSHPPEYYMRQRILSTMRIYPRISPSMLQSGLGPHNPPSIWRPVLEDLIAEGLVQRLQESVQNERGRFRTVTILQLSRFGLEAASGLGADNTDADNGEESGESELEVA